MNKPNINYFRNQRKALSIHIPNGNHRILDVGCGSGHFGANLKMSGKAAQVFGIEIFGEAAKEAASHLDGVKCADLDTLVLSELHQEWGQLKFDYIVFADVLEHVKNPWAALEEFKKWLFPNGKVIISIPNVRHWSVLFSLALRGRWDYQDAGIMDRTHLRFFTKSTACEMAQKSGYQIASVSPLIGGRWKTLSRVSGGLLDEFFAIQFVIVGELRE